MAIVWYARRYRRSPSAVGKGESARGGKLWTFPCLWAWRPPRALAFRVTGVYLRCGNRLQSNLWSGAA
jgi:hypothetical protein